MLRPAILLSPMKNLMTAQTAKFGENAATVPDTVNAPTVIKYVKYRPILEMVLKMYIKLIVRVTKFMFLKMVCPFGTIGDLSQTLVEGDLMQKGGSETF